jgi:ABC-type sulfate transport system permease subunit
VRNGALFNEDRRHRNFWKGGYRPTKTVELLYIAFAIPFVVCMVVGLIYFLHAPIRQVGNAYVDKLGRPHTAECYNLFQWWELISVVTGVFFGSINFYTVIEFHFRKGSHGDGTAPKKPQSEEI